MLYQQDPYYVGVIETTTVFCVVQSLSPQYLFQQNSIHISRTVARCKSGVLSRVRLEMTSFGGASHKRVSRVTVVACNEYSGLFGASTAGYTEFSTVFTTHVRIRMIGILSVSHSPDSRKPWSSDFHFSRIDLLYLSRSLLQTYLIHSSPLSKRRLCSSTV